MRTAGFNGHLYMGCLAGGVPRGKHPPDPEADPPCEQNDRHL